MNEDKIIFLDFDGVINGFKSLIEDNSVVDRHNALVLKKILEKTGSKIVTISSVRPIKKECFNKNRYLIELKKYNIEVYDTLLDYKNDDWELMVNHYIDHYKINKFCIIDDEPMRFKNSKNLQDHLVVPVLYQGLRIEHIKAVSDILNGKLGIYPSYIDVNETGEELNLRANKYHSYLIKKR